MLMMGSVGRQATRHTVHHLRLGRNRPNFRGQFGDVLPNFGRNHTTFGLRPCPTFLIWEAVGWVSEQSCRLGRNLDDAGPNIGQVGGSNRSLHPPRLCLIKQYQICGMGPQAWDFDETRSCRHGATRRYAAPMPPRPECSCVPAIP